MFSKCLCFREKLYRFGQDVAVSYIFMWQEAEQKAAARADKQEAREAHAREQAAAAQAAAYAEAHPAKSPSDFSCQSYELFVNQERGNQDDNTRERMSLRSDPFQDSVSTQPAHKPTEPHHDARRARKVSMVSMQRSTRITSLTMIPLNMTLDIYTNWHCVIGYDLVYFLHTITYKITSLY